MEDRLDGGKIIEEECEMSKFKIQLKRKNIK
jgi:hypothetical protein